jgi:hypothetical protein
MSYGDGGFHEVMSDMKDPNSNLIKTSDALRQWTDPHNQDNRYRDLYDMATRAGVVVEFTAIPDIHFKTMSYTEYWITVLALGKLIRGVRD